MCSIIGLLANGIIGFGVLLVSGRSRVPSPPARMTAFTTRSLRCGWHRPVAQRGAGDRHVGERGVVAEHETAHGHEPRRGEHDVVGVPWMASAQRKSGKANMRARVPALPTHCTSMRRAPAAASASTATLTTTSRARTRMPTTSGTLPCTISATAATSSRIRSATGSSTLPRSLPWSKRRAIQPSTQSEAPSTASSAAAARSSSSASSHTNTGTHARRTSEMRFGTVTILRLRIRAHRGIVGGRPSEQPRVRPAVDGNGGPGEEGRRSRSTGTPRSARSPRDRPSTPAGMPASRGSSSPP